MMVMHKATVARRHSVPVGQHRRGPRLLRGARKRCGSRSTSAGTCYALFNFNNNDSNSSSLSRSDFDVQEVEDYFNYMGMLAAEVRSGVFGRGGCWSVLFGCHHHVFLASCGILLRSIDSCGVIRRCFLVVLGNV